MSGDDSDAGNDDPASDNSRTSTVKLLPLRLRAFLDGNTTTVVALLVIGALLSGAVFVSAHAGDETRTDVETVDTWTVESDFHHAATVQRDAGPFTAGDRLENRSTYFTAITPELEGTYVLDHDGAEPATLDANLELVVRSTETVDGEEVVHWEEREALATAEDEAVPADEPATLSFAVNVTEIDERIEAIESDVGASPGTTEIRLVADATLDGAVAGDAAVEERTERLELDPSGDTYRVTDEVEGANTHEATETTEVPVEPDLLRGYGSLLVALLAGTIAGVVYRADQQGQFVVPETERTRVRLERERGDLDEWISPGRPPANDDRDRVEMDGLEALVDVAIDSDRRVIEVNSGERYVVIVDDVRYEYEPPLTVR